MTRYFTDGTNVWKFAPNQHPLHRFTTDPKWEESAFVDLAEFEASRGDMWEIDGKDGEL